MDVFGFQHLDLPNSPRSSDRLLSPVFNENQFTCFLFSSAITYANEAAPEPESEWRSAPGWSARTGRTAATLEESGSRVGAETEDEGEAEEPFPLLP